MTGERNCKVCGRSYVIGSRDVCSECRQQGRRPVKVQPTKYGPTKAVDSRIDVGYAIEELQRARDELTAIPPDLLRHKRDEALAEPLARVLLASRFLSHVLARHGVRVELDEVSACDD